MLNSMNYLRVFLSFSVVGFVRHTMISIQMSECSLICIKAQHSLSF